MSGPVWPTSAATAVLRPLPLDDATFAPDGFLGAWQQRNATRPLPHCIGRLATAGNLDTLRRATGDTGGDYQNMWFADSDVYKTLEAAAWQLGRTPDAADLRAFLDTTTALLAKAQGEDGYLN